ncbi:tumor protein p53-inducible nuclear protein 1 [Plakobranchus ocellatus]|uniref:Tumor protein p53-inducible nuclear protein 1 n=1 Tax=Plakobranchus ocellatus TaxID=259542 RepID=A0AAV3Y3P6_9GAST|nr:tumor protein p53-inducible nuclear protein 1 [Plakobranchus ocellatus]
MLNSVAKYLWGSSSETEQGPVSADCDSKDQGLGQQDPDAEQQLATQHVEEDEWVMVGLLGKDKENSGQSNQTSPHDHTHHHPHHPHHSPNYHHNHNQPHPLSSQAEGSPSLPQNGLCCAGAEEALDDAASLIHNVDLAGEMSGPVNLDLDSNYSSDTESSPESVFSACSGRSHATYHPRGNSSEPWVIAPPPCFTGSQVGTLSPVAASPLENLLIEHPSMSVYLSVPPSALPASHPYLSAPPPTGESIIRSVDSKGQDSGSEANTSMANSNELRASPLPVRPTDQDFAWYSFPPAPCTRSSPRNGGLVHHEAATAKEVARITRSAQQVQCSKAQKMITSQRCARQNKVRDIKSHPKGKSNNRRSKQLHASGAKCTRFSQRV